MDVEDRIMHDVVGAELEQLVADGPDAPPNPRKVGATVTPGATPGAFQYTFIGIDFPTLYQRLTHREQEQLQYLLQKMLPPEEGT